MSEQRTAGGLAERAVRILEGFFNDRDPKVVDDMVAAPYYQHNPAVPNGPEAIRGFVESISGMTQPIVSVKRAVAEGDLAAVHSHYAWSPTFELDGGRGSAIVDILRFDQDGKAIEHWDVVRAVPETTASGNSMFDGGGDPGASADIEANKATVRRLYEAFQAGDTGAFDELIVEGYIQHNPQVPNGRDAVKGFFSQIGPVDVDVKRMIAQGDLVVGHAHYRSFNSAAVDIYRLADGRIVEHWDVGQEVPLATASGNDMFSQKS